MWPLVALVVMGWSTKVAPAEHEPAWTVFRVVPYALRLERRGIASYYARRFHGHIMQNGQRYDERRLTAASNDIPMGQRARVCREDRRYRCVEVEITDVGNLYGRLIDLSRTAAKQLGMINQGIVVVRVCRVESM